MPPFHPDQLEPGSQVGPWRVVASLGAGGFGRVFKVERGGRYYSLKMALRPAGPHAAEEEDVNGRLAHEVAALLACAPHPNLPRVHSVDRWPEPPDGYLYFVTDFVDGETFHEWRWRVKPTAAHLLSVFTEVVRVVADLHRRGVHHRDLKGDNLLIRREDERPFLIDLGTVRMPGASTLTVGVAPASPHLLPPECVAFLREGAWQQGAHFDAGVPGDLYALGALLYEALTDGYAFDPRLPYDRLLPAIELVTPREPQVVNPKVPRALGDIAMKLLAKRPEDRYPGTEALLQALWDVAKEKRQPAWRVSLDRPPEAEAPPGTGAETPRVRMVPELAHAPLETLKLPESRERLAAAEPAPTEGHAPVPAAILEAPSAPALAPQAGEEPHAASSPPAPRVSRRAAMGLGVLLLLVLSAFGLSRLKPPPGGVTAPVPPLSSEKGSPDVTNHSPSSPDASTLMAALPARDAGEVTDAGLQASAPVREPPGSGPKAPPRKRQGSNVARAATAACLLGAASCAGTSGQLRTAPPVKPCPPENIKAMYYLGFPVGAVLANRHKLRMNMTKRPTVVPVPPEGPVTFYVNVEYAANWAPYTVIPVGTRFHGHLYRGKTRVFASVFEVEFPDGKRVPVCANLTDEQWYEDILGVALDESSTPENPMMPLGNYVVGSDSFGRLRRLGSYRHEPASEPEPIP